MTFPLTNTDKLLQRERRLEGLNLQGIENNSLSPEEVEMFEMFDAKGWSNERRRDYLDKHCKEIEGEIVAAE